MCAQSHMCAHLLKHGGICPFEGGHPYHHYHVMTSGQTTTREHSPTHLQKIGLKT